VRSYSTRGGLRFVVFVWKKSGLTWTHGFRACILMIGRAHKKRWRIIFRVLPRSITPSFGRRRNPVTGSGSSPVEKCLRGMKRGSRTAWSESRPTSANESVSITSRGSSRKSERCSAPAWISMRRWGILHDWLSVILRTSVSSTSTGKVVAVTAESYEPRRLECLDFRFVPTAAAEPASSRLAACRLGEQAAGVNGAIITRSSRHVLPTARAHARAQGGGFALGSRGASGGARKPSGGDYPVILFPISRL